jgi:hypothetical protein
MREKKNIFQILVGKFEGSFQLKDAGVDGRIVLKGTSHDRDKWRAVVNTVMKLWIL